MSLDIGDEALVLLFGPCSFVGVFLLTARRSTHIDTAPPPPTTASKMIMVRMVENEDKGATTGVVMDDIVFVGGWVGG